MPPVFATPRLLVRNLNLDDLDAFHEMQGNLNVMKYTTGRSMTFDENKSGLQKVIAHYSQPGNDFWVWAVVTQAGQFVGTCALIQNDKGEREIGYRFLERYWGHGYGKEITIGLIEYGLNHLDIEELVAYVDKKNIPSVKILDATFRLEKEYYNEEEKCVDRFYKISK